MALLRALPRPVAFVGDGVKDGPALAAVDYGISVAELHSADPAATVISRCLRRVILSRMAVPSS